MTDLIDGIEVRFENDEYVLYVNDVWEFKAKDRNKLSGIIAMLKDENFGETLEDRIIMIYQVWRHM